MATRASVADSAGNLSTSECLQELDIRLKWGNCSTGARPGLIVNRSTARRRAPARPYILAVFDDARHGRIIIRKSEHLLAPLEIVLRVVLCKGNALGIVIILG